MCANISSQQVIHGKSAALALIVGEKHDGDVFHGDNQSHGPDDQRQRAQEVVVARRGAEGGRIDIERTRANIACGLSDLPRFHG
jgi:hypothetical protein